MRKHLNIYTHNGLFHADDVFAAAMLSLITEDINIVRDGEENIPEGDDWIVFDIGGGHLDHHTPENKENNGTHPNTDIPYASCGLVWKEYYQEILKEENCPERYMETVYQKMEKSLILGIDAADNGFNPIKNALESMPNIPSDQQRELIAQGNIPFTLTQIIKDFNPTWESDRDMDEAFMDAMSFAKDIFLNRLDSIIDALDGKDYILNHIDFSAEHIMILEQFAPWQGVVTSESRSNPKAQDIWYVVSPALRGGWNVQCVLDNPDDRVSYRHPLPQSWYGLRNEELQAASGVADARFCHPSGFLAGADSQSGALQMAYKAIGNTKMKSSDIQLVQYLDQKEQACRLIAGFWHDHNGYDQTLQEAENNLKEWTQEEHLFLLVLLQDTYIGFAHLGSRGGNIDWLEDLYICKEYQRHGYGHRVVCMVEQMVRTWSDSMYIEAAARNKDAVRLYHSLGFDVLNTITMRKYFKPQDFETAAQETIDGMIFQVRKVRT